MYICRPRTIGGRPLSGIVRPSTSSASGNNLQKALKTPRTVGSSRPLTSQLARNVRLGTASMVSQMDGPFVNISRLNFPKYASDKQLSKLLFNYIYYQQNDIRNVRISVIIQNILVMIFIYFKYPII